MVKNIDTFIFLSKILSKRVAGNIREEQIQIIPNTADTALRCTEKEIEQKIGSKKDREDFNVTFLTNMIVSKGYKDLMKAVPVFKNNCSSNIKLTYIGKWQSEKQLNLFKERLKVLGIEDNIIIWGIETDRSKIKNELLNSDAFVLPTYYPEEAQPATIIEALNAATPIIATNHASIPDLVIDDKNGYLVEKKSPQQIAEALIKLYDYPNWKKKALAARSIYMDKCSPDVIKNKLVEQFSN